MTKVTLIGAGSVEFTRGLVADLFTSKELQGTLTISLNDIDAERLARAEAVTNYTNEQTGAGAVVEAHADRRAAIEGADYVVNEIRVGGYASTLLDFEIPKKYGLRQTIADTIGVGGIFLGLRTIPVVAAIGADMAEVCPDALLLNYTNPMAMIPWGVYAGSPHQRVFGLCHSVRDTHRFLARTVGVPQDDIEYLTAGFNHQAFVIRFERRSTGENLYPLLDDAIARDPEGLGRRVRVELYRQIGFFPTESSEHSAEYVPWFMGRDDMIERYRIPVDEYLRRSEDNLDEYREIGEALAAGTGFPIEPAHELASNVIEGIETDSPRGEYVNVRNTGLIANLPDGCCVEVPANVDGTGIHPVAVGEVPPQCAAINRTFLNVVELTVRAALEGDRRHVYQAAALDPNAGANVRLDDIRSMCDELIEAHGDLMPEGVRTV